MYWLIYIFFGVCRNKLKKRKERTYKTSPCVSVNPKNKSTAVPIAKKSNKPITRYTSIIDKKALILLIFCSLAIPIISRYNEYIHAIKFMNGNHANKTLGVIPYAIALNVFSIPCLPPNMYTPMCTTTVATTRPTKVIANADPITNNEKGPANNENSPESTAPINAITTKYFIVSLLFSFSILEKRLLGLEKTILIFSIISI